LALEVAKEFALDVGRQQEDLLKKDCQLVDPDMEKAMLKDLEESRKKIVEHYKKMSPGT